MNISASKINMDIRQSSLYAEYLARIGWGVKKIEGVYCYYKKIPILGIVVKVQRPNHLPLKRIEDFFRKKRLFQIIIEPLRDDDVLKKYGFKLSKSPYLPTKTLFLDLSKSEKELFNQFKKDCRYALKKSLDLKVELTSDLCLFRKIWKSSVGWRRYVPPLSHLEALKEVFGKKCFSLLSRRKQSDFDAGAILLLADEKAYYWQAFTSSQGRESLSAYRLVWEGIKWAKKEGAKVFDFEGIYDNRFPNNSWLGFTHFKKSFGGYEVEYPGCFVKSALSRIF